MGDRIRMPNPENPLSFSDIRVRMPAPVSMPKPDTQDWIAGSKQAAAPAEPTTSTAFFDKLRHQQSQIRAPSPLVQPAPQLNLGPFRPPTTGQKSPGKEVADSPVPGSSNPLRNSPAAARYPLPVSNSYGSGPALPPSLPDLDFIAAAPAVVPDNLYGRQRPAICAFSFTLC